MPVYGHITAEKSTQELEATRYIHIGEKSEKSARKLLIQPFVHLHKD